MTCKYLTQFISETFLAREKVKALSREDFPLLLELKKRMEIMIDEINKIDPFDLKERKKIAEMLDLEEIGMFHDGWAKCFTGQDFTRYRFVNRAGEYLKREGNNITFAAADRFSEGFAAVSYNNKTRFLRPDGTFLPAEFEFTTDLSKCRFSHGIGHAPLNDPFDGDYWIGIDANGIVVPGRSKGVEPFSANGLARITTKNNRASYLKTDGTFFELADGQKEFDYCTPFSDDGYAFVIYWDFNNGVQRFRSIIDTSGATIKNFPEDRAMVTLGEFSSGWAVCEETLNEINGAKSISFMNIEGEKMVDEFGNTEFISAGIFSCGLACVGGKQEGKKRYYSFINPAGKYLRDKDGQIMEFENTGFTLVGDEKSFSEGLAKIYSESRDDYYFIDTKGRKVEFGHK